MERRLDPSHPLYAYVYGVVHEQVCRHLVTSGAPEIEEYLTGLLLDFVRTDRLYAIRDHEGNPIRSVIEMLGEADVRVNAASFDREREVHKHVGDFILFWSGVTPSAMNSMRASTGLDIATHYLRQGQESYYVVSTFDHKPYDDDAPVFRQMSGVYEALAFVMGQVNAKARLFPTDL